jgi:peptidoglycan pentaglycine glycine transferase (the first glycine)
MTTETKASERSVLHRVTTAERWQAVLSQLPMSHPLQSWAWGEFKSRWGWSARPLLLSVHAAALVLKRQAPGLRLSILYVPRGPLLDYTDGALRRVMLAQLERLARVEGAIYVKIDPEVAAAWGTDGVQRSPIGRKFAEEMAARGWRLSADQVQFRNTVELDLTRSEDEILGAMRPKTRYNIGLARRKEVVVRPGTAADFPQLVAMYLETAARDSFAARPAAYYLDAWQTFYAAGMAQPLIAEHDGRALAAVIIVHDGRRAIYMYGASTQLERPRMPNYLLQWEAIRWARAQGYEVYDLWGAPDEFLETDALWGVWRFKAGFEGRVVQHIGAWDYPARPFWYWLYTAVVPRYVAFLRRRNPQISQITQKE